MKAKHVTLLLVFLGTTAFAADVVPLKLDLPDVPPSPTPETVKSDNLEPKGTKRPPIMVPKGIENVAADKSVTSSDKYPIIGDLEMATDGDKAGSDGSYVELGPNKQWIQIDLEKEYEIHAVALWLEFKLPTIYKDMVIQLSNDKKFKDGVVTVFNNDHDNSSGFGVGKDKEYYSTLKGRAVAIRKVKARYVRINTNGSATSELNRYIEIEVYGQ